MTTRMVGLWMALGISAASCASDTDAELSEVGSVSPLTAASVDLIAIGRLDATADLATQTAGVLENGLPGNLLGGVGSGLTRVRANTYLAIPDRGSNATAYNSAIDDTTSYIPRFHTLKLKLQKNAKGASLPFSLTPALGKTTLLWDRSPLTYAAAGAPALNEKKKFYFSGRSDNFDPNLPSTNPLNGRFDPENIRVSTDGKHVFVADEYGPYIYQFERHSGRRERAFVLPSEFAAVHLSAKGDTEISGNTVGRVANKGMEGLAISPDGNILVGAMQSPLAQDGGTNGRYLRIVSIDIASGATEQFAYPLTNIGTEAKPKYPTVSEITAINAHELLVDERDGKGLGDNSTAVFKQIFHIDLSQGSDVSGLSGEANLAPHTLSKTLFVDLVAQLNAHGLSSNDIPAKLEGLTIGPDVTLDGVVKHTLFVSTDNDFLATITDSNHPQGIDNPNQFFVFAVDSAALAGLTPQTVERSEDDDGEEQD
jgi:hypothetical protein